RTITGGVVVGTLISISEPEVTAGSTRTSGPYIFAMAVQVIIPVKQGADVGIGTHQGGSCIGFGFPESGRSQFGSRLLIKQVIHTGGQKRTRSQDDRCGKKYS